MTVKTRERKTYKSEESLWSMKYESDVLTEVLVS